MSYSQDTIVGWKRSGSLGSLDVSGTNETLKVQVPVGVSVPLLQAKNLTARAVANPVWYPVGFWYTITTDVAATAATVVLRKNGVSPLTGGTATVAVAVAGANELFAPFSNWTYAAALAAGDQWSILVTVVSNTTGVINPCVLAYGVGSAVGITDGTAL